MLEMYKEVHLCDFPMHRHHRFGDNGALCGSHSIQFYAVTLIASDHRKMMSPQLLAGTTKRYLFRMGRSEVRLKPEGTSEFEEPQITHTHTQTVITWHCWLNFSEDVNCDLGQGSKAF